MELVKELMTRMLRIGQTLQLFAKNLNLGIAEDANTLQIALFVIEGDLLVREAKCLPLLCVFGQFEQCAQRSAILR